jgi:protein-arginine kinase activator protein McsA
MQAEQRREKRETCARCHLKASFVEGAVIERGDVLFFVCQLCALHEHIRYWCSDFYDRFGNLLQQ